MCPDLKKFEKTTDVRIHEMISGHDLLRCDYRQMI